MGGWCTPGTSAPGSPTGRCASWRRCSPRARPRRSTAGCRGRSPGTRGGSSRPWSARSPTRSGPRTGGCATRRGGGCATTSIRRTSWSSGDARVSRDGVRGRTPGVTRQRVRVDGRQLVVSNLDKVLFPDVSFTKAQVIDYYVRIAPVLLPHLSGRPVTFTRWPDGVEGQAFFEKNSARHAPDWVRRVSVPSPGSSTGRETLEMVLLETVADLAWSGNLAALELHVPQWQVDEDGAPQLPDLLVLDLDPGPKPRSPASCSVVAALHA